MGTRIKFQAILGLLIVPWLATSCGSDGVVPSGTTSGGGSSSGVGIDGSVEIPVTTSTNVIVGESVSKGVSKGSAAGPEDSNAKIIVYKATSDLPASSGSCSCKTPGGVVLDSFELGTGGKFSGAIVDATKLDSSKQVLIDCKTGDGKRFSTLCNLTDTANGQTINCGKVNSDTTLYTSQTISECGSGTSLDSLSACASASGFKPLALFQTFQNISGSAGVSDTAGIHEAYKKMIRAAYASGSPPSPADIVNMIKGDTSLINKFKTLDPAIAGLDATALADGMKAFPGACKGYYGDDTLFSNYVKAGVSSFKSGGADFFKNLKAADLDKMKAKPALYQTIMGQYASAAASGTANVFKNFGNADFARTVAGLGQFIDPTDFSAAGKAAAYRNLLEGGTWGTSKDPAQLAEAFGNACKSGDKASEFAAWNTNGSAFAGKYINNPAAYLGSTGLGAMDNQYISFFQDKNTFVGAAQGCTPGVSTSCPSGQTCSSGGFCIATCTANCGFGTPCSTNGQCGATGYCHTGSGYCAFNPTAGVDPLASTLKASGSACTLASECSSGACSSGVCGYFVPAGSATFAGFYRRNSGCKFAFNIDGPSANSVVSWSPYDPANQSDNLVYGGFATWSGTSSPFSVTNAAVYSPSNGQTGTMTCSSITLSGTTMTGTCTLGGGLSGSCSLNHTKL